VTSFVSNLVSDSISAPTMGDKHIHITCIARPSYIYIYTRALPRSQSKACARYSIVLHMHEHPAPPPYRKTIAKALTVPQCQKIIGSAPVGDQYHGCPYKHWDEKHLVDALNQMRRACPNPAHPSLIEFDLISFSSCSHAILCADHAATPQSSNLHSTLCAHFSSSRSMISRDMSPHRIAVPSNVVHDVVDKVKGQHYQVACLKVFEATHPGGTSESLQHPNTYFQDSMRYYEDKEKKNEEKAAGGGAADRQPTVEGQAVKMDTA
jgi:hypothetical protein